MIHAVNSKLHSYAQAYQYLCQFTDYERMARVHYNQTTYNLKRMKWLLQALGNPLRRSPYDSSESIGQDKLRCIHIAGTKGKGSTAMMIAKILSSAGYRVGLYTSPHLVDLRERIQLWHNDKQTLIPKNDFTNLINHLIDRTHSAIRHSPFAIGSPTFFETMTAMAFLYFTQQKVDFALIEVGLGGRLDATNLITPIVSVITRIDLDHTDKLGNTIREIAYEKAGIIKEGIPVVTFNQNSPADEVIRQKTRIRKAPVYIAKILTHKLNLLGSHQQENYSLANGVIKLLNSHGYTRIKTSSINKALKGFVLPARLEYVRHRPDIIIDSAHNPVSIKATIQTIQRLKYCKIILILALSKDKDVNKILDIIIPHVDIVILTKTQNSRLLGPEEFIEYLPAYSDKIILLEPNHINALNLAIRLAIPNSLIIATGSFYLAGPIRELLATKTLRHEEF